MLKFFWEHLIRLVVFIAVAIPIFSFVTIQFRLLPKIEKSHDKIVKQQRKILSDLAYLDEHSPFPESRYDHNADEILNQYVSLEGAGAYPLNSEQNSLIRELFKKYATWRDNPAKFRALMHDPILKKLNSNWMKNLALYDHWNFSDRPEVKTHLEKLAQATGLKKAQLFENLPSADYSELREWALVNFLKLHKQGKTIEGFKTYRKVEELAHSSNTLVGNMVTTAMMRDERYFIETFGIVTKWPLMPMQTIEAYHRVTWAWMGLVNLTSFLELPAAFKPYLKSQNAVCAAAWESTPAVALQEDFLSGNFLFEMDFSSNVKKAKNFQSDLYKICHLDSYKNMLDRAPASLSKPAVKKARELSAVWMRVPYLRQIIGMNKLTKPQYNYTKYYE